MSGVYNDAEVAMQSIFRGNLWSMVVLWLYMSYIISRGIILTHRRLSFWHRYF